MSCSSIATIHSQLKIGHAFPVWAVSHSDFKYDKRFRTQNTARSHPIPSHQQQLVPMWCHVRNAIFIGRRCYLIAVVLVSCSISVGEPAQAASGQSFTFGFIKTWISPIYEELDTLLRPVHSSRLPVCSGNLVVSWSSNNVLTQHLILG